MAVVESHYSKAISCSMEADTHFRHSENFQDSSRVLNNDSNVSFKKCGNLSNEFGESAHVRQLVVQPSTQLTTADTTSTFNDKNLCEGSTETQEALIDRVLDASNEEVFLSHSLGEHGGSSESYLKKAKKEVLERFKASLLLYNAEDDLTSIDGCTSVSGESLGFGDREAVPSTATVLDYIRKPNQLGMLVAELEISPWRWARDESPLRLADIQAPATPESIRRQRSQLCVPLATRGPRDALLEKKGQAAPSRARGSDPLQTIDEEVHNTIGINSRIRSGEVTEDTLLHRSHGRKNEELFEPQNFTRFESEGRKKECMKHEDLTKREAEELPPSGCQTASSSMSMSTLSHLSVFRDGCRSGSHRQTLKNPQKVLSLTRDSDDVCSSRKFNDNESVESPTPRMVIGRSVEQFVSPAHASGTGVQPDLEPQSLLNKKVSRSGKDTLGGRYDSPSAARRSANTESRKLWCEDDEERGSLTYTNTESAVSPKTQRTVISCEHSLHKKFSQPSQHESPIQHRQHRKRLELQHDPVSENQRDCHLVNPPPCYESNLASPASDNHAASLESSSVSSSSVSSTPTYVDKGREAELCRRSKNNTVLHWESHVSQSLDSAALHSPHTTFQHLRDGQAGYFQPDNREDVSNSDSSSGTRMDTTPEDGRLHCEPTGLNDESVPRNCPSALLSSNLAAWRRLWRRSTEASTLFGVPSKDHYGAVSSVAHESDALLVSDNRSSATPVSSNPTHTSSRELTVAAPTSGSEEEAVTRRLPGGPSYLKSFHCEAHLRQAMHTGTELERFSDSDATLRVASDIQSSDPSGTGGEKGQWVSTATPCLSSSSSAIEDSECYRLMNRHYGSASSMSSFTGGATSNRYLPPVVQSSSASAFCSTASSDGAPNSSNISGDESVTTAPGGYLRAAGRQHRGTGVQTPVPFRRQPLECQALNAVVTDRYHHGATGVGGGGGVALCPVPEDEVILTEGTLTANYGSDERETDAETQLITPSMIVDLPSGYSHETPSTITNTQTTEEPTTTTFSVASTTPVTSNVSSVVTARCPVSFMSSNGHHAFTDSAVSTQTVTAASCRGDKSFAQYASPQEPIRVRETRQGDRQSVGRRELYPVASEEGLLTPTVDNTPYPVFCANASGSDKAATQEKERVSMPLHQESRGVMVESVANDHQTRRSRAHCGTQYHKETNIDKGGRKGEQDEEHTHRISVEDVEDDVSAASGAEHFPDGQTTERSSLIHSDTTYQRELSKKKCGFLGKNALSRRERVTIGMQHVLQRSTNGPLGVSTGTVRVSHRHRSKWRQQRRESKERTSRHCKSQRHNPRLSEVEESDDGCGAEQPGGRAAASCSFSVAELDGEPAVQKRAATQESEVTSLGKTWMRVTARLRSHGLSHKGIPVLDADVARVYELPLAVAHGNDDPCYPRITRRQKKVERQEEQRRLEMLLANIDPMEVLRLLDISLEELGKYKTYCSELHEFEGSHGHILRQNDALKKENGQLKDKIASLERLLRDRAAFTASKWSAEVDLQQAEVQRSALVKSLQEQRQKLRIVLAQKRTLDTTVIELKTQVSRLLERENRVRIKAKEALQRYWKRNNVRLPSNSSCLSDKLEEDYKNGFLQRPTSLPFVSKSPKLLSYNNTSTIAASFPVTTSTVPSRQPPPLQQHGSHLTRHTDQGDWSRGHPSSSVSSSGYPSRRQRLVSAAPITKNDIATVIWDYELQLDVVTQENAYLMKSLSCARKGLQLPLRQTRPSWSPTLSLIRDALGLPPHDMAKTETLPSLTEGEQDDGRKATTAATLVTNSSDHMNDNKGPPPHGRGDTLYSCHELAQRADSSLGRAGGGATFLMGTGTTMATTGPLPMLGDGGLAATTDLGHDKATDEAVRANETHQHLGVKGAECLVIESLNQQLKQTVEEKIRMELRYEAELKVLREQVESGRHTRTTSSTLAEMQRTATTLEDFAFETAPQSSLLLQKATTTASAASGSTTRDDDIANSHTDFKLYLAPNAFSTDQAVPDRTSELEKCMNALLRPETADTAVSSSNIEPGGTTTTTQQLISRDRWLYQTGFQKRLQALPHGRALWLIDQSCRDLGVADPENLPSVVSRAAAAISRVAEYQMCIKRLASLTGVKETAFEDIERIVWSWRSFVLKAEDHTKLRAAVRHAIRAMYDITGPSHPVELNADGNDDGGGGWGKNGGGGGGGLTAAVGNTTCSTLNMSSEQQDVGWSTTVKTGEQRFFHHATTSAVPAAADAHTFSETMIGDDDTVLAQVLAEKLRCLLIKVYELTKAVTTTTTASPKKGGTIGMGAHFREQHAEQHRRECSTESAPHLGMIDNNMSPHFDGHLVHNIVKHFMSVFKVPKLEVCESAIDRLHLKVKEHIRFYRGVITVLSLSATTHPSEILKRIALIHNRAQHLEKLQEQEVLMQKQNKLQLSPRRSAGIQHILKVFRQIQIRLSLPDPPLSDVTSIYFEDQELDDDDDNDTHKKTSKATGLHQESRCHVTSNEKRQNSNNLKSGKKTDIFDDDFCQDDHSIVPLASSKGLLSASSSSSSASVLSSGDGATESWKDWGKECLFTVDLLARVVERTKWQQRKNKVKT